MVIDDSMPLGPNGNTIYAGKSEDGALWGMLIEKAFAKLHGNWESIISGDPRHSIGILSGAPVEHHYHRCPATFQSCKTKTANEIFDLIKEANDAGNMISAITPNAAGGNS